MKEPATSVLMVDQFFIDKGGSRFFLNIGACVPYYTASSLRRDDAV
jgi:hypothetical protein